MAKSKVTMICREIWRATVIVDHPQGEDLEVIKDRAWQNFDTHKSPSLEQENFTKVEEITDG